MNIEPIRLYPIYVVRDSQTGLNDQSMDEMSPSLFSSYNVAYEESVTFMRVLNLGRAGDYFSKQKSWFQTKLISPKAKY